MSYDSDSDMERGVGGRRRRGGAVAGAGRGQRDPMVHMMKHQMAVERAMGDGRSPAQHHRAMQKSTHKHMMGHGVAGAGFISDLGIPIISNLAGAIGLGRKGRKGGAYAGAGGMDNEYYYHSPPFAHGGAMTGGGFISDLGIPVVSQLAGAIGLGRKGRKGGAMTGGMMLGQDGHGVYHGGAYAGAGTKKGQVRRTARRAYEGGAYAGAGATGAGFWDDFKSGFNSVVAPVASIAKPLLSLAGPEGRVASTALGALGYGKQKRRSAGPHDGRRARAQIVKKVMMERGVSLPEASKIVKAEGLY